MASGGGVNSVDAHGDLDESLADEHPNSVFDMNTGAGQKGPDAVWIDGEDPGFDALDTKPDNDRGIKEFIKQRAKWEEFERVKIWLYDEGGTIRDGGVH
jgi:hypothetical protein